MNGKASTVIVPTIGLPHYFSTYKLSDGSLVNVKILDTAGQEKFKSISESYYKKADCCLLVYDISKRESFEQCANYYNKNIKEKCKKDIKVIVLGNKSDLEEKRQILSEDAANFCLQNEYIFMETSCLKNTNVSDAFETLIEMTHIEAMKNQLNKANKVNKNLSLSKKGNKNNNRNKNNCC